MVGTQERGGKNATGRHFLMFVKKVAEGLSNVNTFPYQKDSPLTVQHSIIGSRSDIANKPPKDESRINTRIA